MAANIQVGGIFAFFDGLVPCTGLAQDFLLRPNLFAQSAIIALELLTHAGDLSVSGREPRTAAA